MKLCMMIDIADKLYDMIEGKFEIYNRKIKQMCSMKYVAEVSRFVATLTKNIER